MTPPKNTPQDEKEAIEFARHLTRPLLTDDELVSFKSGAHVGFLRARLGYVPNQTVVAIAEAARKEERERCAEVVRKLFFDKQVEAFAVEHILNPPEAK